MNEHYMAFFATSGGTAFPFSGPAPLGGEVSWPGMSLRDWFAGQALAGVITLCAGETVRSGTIAEHMARRAYQMADAMLAARTRRSEPEGE